MDLHASAKRVSLSIRKESVLLALHTCSGTVKSAVTTQIAGEAMFGVLKNDAVSQKKLLIVQLTLNGMELTALAMLATTKSTMNV